MLCVHCGLENDAAARFCQACGGPLGGDSGERRTVVTVLFCDVVDSTALADHDAMTQALWRQVQALVEAHRGQFDDAERLGREAVAVLETTDSLYWQGDALWDLAEVLHAAGRADEAAATFDRALERYEQKRNWSKAMQLGTRRAELRGAAG